MSRRIQPRFPLGSLSTGTLRTEDLASAASDALWTLYQYGYALKMEVTKLMSELEDVEKTACRDECEPEDVLSEAEQFINEHCPPYVYYGSLEGDGADIGFWPCIESLTEDRNNGDVINYDLLAFDSKPMRQYHGLAVEVNDHGNVTLYQVRGRSYAKELWSCV